MAKWGYFRVPRVQEKMRSKKYKSLGYCVA
jgi:hypothetical protein